ncbi:TPA: DUF2461 family protein [Escherichia coli]|mgnify:CR=1 FL=1|nr:DUF2461 family protein [Escherichia coli]
MKNIAAPHCQLSRERIAFLSEVKRQNSKEWYEANKHIYNSYLLKPF